MTQKLAILGGAPVRRRPFTRWPIHGKPEERRLLQALRSGAWGRLQGKQVEEFERRFAAMHGCKHGIAVANGTVSLRISLLAGGIQADDEVIVPPYTFLSTASAVVESNAIPVFADIDPGTFNLDPKAVEAAITPRTRAIIPVHFAGQVADIEAINRIARRHGLLVIEDAAHAHAGAHRAGPAGSLGDVGSFSFQSSKNLTAGEGGIIITNNDTLAASCRSIQSCGRIEGGPWYEHHVISGNYRLGEFQGAILNAQLGRLEKQAKTRERNGSYLASKLSALPGLVPQVRPAYVRRHSYHLFMMRVNPGAFGVPREAVVQALQAEGIPASGGYAFPLSQQPVFRNKAFGPYLPASRARLDYARVPAPHSTLLCREQCLWLEQSLFLGPRRDMDDIVRAFEKIHAHRDALRAHS